MKTLDKNLKIIFASLMIFILSFGNSFAESKILIPENDSVLTQEEINALVKMREEEKLAHEVYSYMYEKWDFIIFKNIAESELRHTNSIKYLLAYYGIDDPYQEGIGNYSNPEFKELYKQLTEESSKSFEDALKTGTKIEDLDIADLDEAISQTKNTRISQLYENLARGSRNHIRILVNQLQMQGITYIPQFIMQKRFNTIISADMERGGFGNRGISMNNQGMNKGMKKGKNKKQGQMRRNNNGNKSGRRSGGCNGRGMGRRGGMGM